MPTTLKEHKLCWHFFLDSPKDANIEEKKDLEEEEMSVNAPKVVRATKTPTTYGMTSKTVTPSAVSTPTSALPSIEKDPANPVLRNLQADYQALLSKDAQSADKVNELESKLSQLAKELEDPRCLQQNIMTDRSATKALFLR
jgi:hypothetical protein